MSDRGAQTIFRNASADKPYSMILNAALQDAALTPEAGWVLVFMLSQSRNWGYNLQHVAAHRRMGRDRVQAAVRELRERGYCKRMQIREKGGRAAGYEYWFTDEPGKFSAPETDLQAPGPSREPEQPAPEQPEPDLQAPYKETTLENNHSRNTPPAPSQARGARRKATAGLPEDWELPDDWREWARTKAPSRSLWISSEADKFKDYHLGKGTRWADWRRAWQNWWRGACERPQPKGSMAAPVKPLAPEKTLGAPVWGSKPDDDVRVYRADTPEFNSYVTRMIAEGSHAEAERAQQRGWIKERPSRMLGNVVEKIVARAGAR